jgi:putative phage-type endonuclease
MAVFLGHHEPGTPGWLALRTSPVTDGTTTWPCALGGSEVAPTLGLSPWESYFSLWYRKQNALQPVEETPEMEWGKRLEPPILAKYLDKHPDARGITPAGQWAHEARPWQIAAPDLLLAGTDELVDAKLSLYGDGWGEQGTDEVPIHIRIQMLWYLDVFELARATLAVLVGGHDYREYVVTYDPVEAEQLRTAALEFLASISAGRRPDLDDHTATYQALRELHPDIDGEQVELDDDLAHRFITSRAELAKAEAAGQLVRSQLADAMGNAKRAVWNGHPIATRQARGNGLPYIVAARNLDDLPLDDIEARSAA